jgi:hypothetical protein
MLIFAWLQNQPGIIHTEMNKIALTDNILAIKLQKHAEKYCRFKNKLYLCTAFESRCVTK